MKLFLKAVSLFITTFAMAGYQDCDVEPQYYNSATKEFIFFNDCDGVGLEDLPELPKGVPSSVDVVGFDSLNPGRKVLRSQLEIQMDGNHYAQIEEKNKAQFDKQFRNDAEKKLKDYLKLWTDRGFQKIELLSLERNKELSKTSESKAYKYYEVFNLPNSETKLVWKMKIERGKITEPFQLLTLKQKKETSLFEHVRSPEWTFTGSRTVNMYTNTEKSFVLVIFSGTWNGMYFAPLK